MVGYMMEEKDPGGGFKRSQGGRVGEVVFQGSFCLEFFFSNKHIAHLAVDPIQLSWII